MSPDDNLIREVATEMGINPAFVEKDWYSVQVLQVVAALVSDDYQCIFAGGTSLSKGYGLIKRFSEDLDFRCLARQQLSNSQQKKRQRNLRNALLDALRKLEWATLDDNAVSRGGNYFKCELTYPQRHGSSEALRAGLQVEFSFTFPNLVDLVQWRPIGSFVTDLTHGTPDVKLCCLSPLETAADKLCALTWRILKRDRNAAGDDPTVVRHLHDIAALSPIVGKNRALFIKTAQAGFDIDSARTSRQTGRPFNVSLQAMLKCLRDDAEYRREYELFVEAMFYADDADNVTFDAALQALQTISAGIS